MVEWTKLLAGAIHADVLKDQIKLVETERDIAQGRLATVSTELAQARQEIERHLAKIAEIEDELAKERDRNTPKRLKRLPTEQEEMLVQLAKNPTPYKQVIELATPQHLQAELALTRLFENGYIGDDGPYGIDPLRPTPDGIQYLAEFKLI